MFPAHRFAAIAATAALSTACFLGLFPVGNARAQGAASACEEAAGLSVLPSPVTPWKGAPLRVIFAAEKPLDGELSLIGPDGNVAAKSRQRHGPRAGRPEGVDGERHLTR